MPEKPVQAMRRGRRAADRRHGQMRAMSRVLAWLPVISVVVVSTSTRGADFAYVFTRNYISIVDTRSSTPSETILTRSPIFGPMRDIILSTDGSTAYLIEGVWPSIRRLDVRTGRLATPLTIPGAGLRFEGSALSDDGRWLFATSADSLLVIDPTIGRAKASICVGRDAEDVGLTLDGRKAYVTTNARHGEIDGFIVVVDLEGGRVQKEIPMPPASRNLDVSPDGQFVYVPHPINATMSIIDTTTDEVAAVIGGARFAGDVAFAPDGSLAYVATWDVEPGVAVIDTTNRTVVGSIAIPARGERLAISSDGGLLYVAHGERSCSVSVVDTRKRVFAGSVDVGDALGVALTPVLREPPSEERAPSSKSLSEAVPELCAYVSHAFEDRISVVDLAAAEVIGQIPVQHPEQLVADSTRSLVYATGNSNRGTAANLTVINATDNEVTASTPLPRGVSSDLDLSADGDFAIMTNWTPCTRLARVDTATGEVAYFLPLESRDPNLVRVAIHPAGKFAYATSGYFDGAGFKILVADVETLSLIDEIPFPEHRPDRIVFTPDGQFAYVVAQPVLDDPPGAIGNDPGFLMVIDTASHQIVSDISVQRQPRSAAISPDGQSIYVSNTSSDSVSVVDTSTNEVRATIPVDEAPTALAVSPDGASLVVASSVSKTLSFIDAESDSVVETIPLPFSLQDLAVVDVPGGCVPPPPWPSPTPMMTPPASICVGDCNGDVSTSVDELLLATGIALGKLPRNACGAADWNYDGRVSVEELVEAVRNAIDGCSFFYCGL